MSGQAGATVGRERATDAILREQLIEPNVE
jgi:hypothetical protein